jgi:hypothetical protein
MHRCARPAVRLWCQMGAATGAATVAERAAVHDDGACTCPLNQVTMEGALKEVCVESVLIPSIKFAECLLGTSIGP